MKYWEMVADYSTTLGVCYESMSEAPTAPKIHPFSHKQAIFPYTPREEISETMTFCIFSFTDILIILKDHMKKTQNATPN